MHEIRDQEDVPRSRHVTWCYYEAFLFVPVQGFLGPRDPSSLLN